MKLFKFLMYSIIAAIAAVIVCGTLTSCHTLKKNSSTHETKSDSLVTKNGTSVRYDSVTGTYMVLRADSTHAVITDDYNRKTIVEEFDVPSTISKEDYGPMYTGDTASQIWKAGHGLLKKRTTTWEKGVLQKTKIKTTNKKDTAAATVIHKAEDTHQEIRQGSHVENDTAQDKQSKSVGRGWIVVACFIVVVLAVGLWLWFYLPKLKSKSND